MGGNNFFAFVFNDVSVNIILNSVFVFLSGENGFCGVKGHNVRISVVRKLLRILIEFL